MKVFLFFLFAFFMLSCNRTGIDDMLDVECMEDVNYTDDVKTIIDNSCAYAGCHLGSAPGDFSAYGSMESYLLNGELRKRSLQIMDMPPSYAPDDKPKSLTEDEIEILSCWVENDYKE